MVQVYDLLPEETLAVPASFDPEPEDHGRKQPTGEEIEEKR